jgi:hypothetical protein
MVYRQLQIGQPVKLRLRHFPAFGGPLATLKPAAERQPRVIEPQFNQKFFNFGSQFSRRADLAQGFSRCRRALSHTEELAAFKLAAPRRAVGINGAGTSGGVESRTRLWDARAPAVEKWRAVARFGPNIGKQNAIAAQAALQAQRVSEFVHSSKYDSPSYRESV